MNLFITFALSNMSTMKGITAWLSMHSSGLFKAFLFVFTTFLIVQVFPRMPRFGYEYQTGRPWTYEDLIAPFDFPIQKGTEEVEEEKELILRDFLPLFSLDRDVAALQLQKFENDFLSMAEKDVPTAMSANASRRLLASGRQILDSIYRRGVILIDGDFAGKPGNTDIRLIEGRVATVRRLQDFFTISQAYQYAEKAINLKAPSSAGLIMPLLADALVQNVFFDRELTEKALEVEMQQIATSHGMVQQGERIISKGELVSAEKFNAIESYKTVSLKFTGEASGRYLIYLGQFLLVGISMIVLILFLYVFRRDVFNSNRKILLILLTILFMISLTGLVLKYNVNFLYLIPVCIVPVVVRAFFDNRLGLYVHIITIIMVGFLIPRSFEFVFMQLIAGIIAILSMVSLRRRSQLFSTVVLIFLTYSSVYLGLLLAHGARFSDLQWIDFLYFSGAALLTLFAYPLIFLFERLFGLPTDFSLLELADTNNALLRKLGMVAPGTFQHSLQVANLAEEAIYSLGGNALLTRTGALYHDIGKMDNAMYFAENQTSGYNPHDDIPYRESASIIIDHVTRGVEMARKQNIPEYIVDFIRTHHGTTTARYFYLMHRKENPLNKADKNDFIYPGPRPFSKETAVVMMADSVEAASRSLSKPDETQINALVDKIIDTQISENQFEFAPITFSDIASVKNLFKKRLMTIYHVRVAYPSME